MFFVCFLVDLSHFRIHELIGAGGFAKVFRAENRRTGASVAIKVMDKRKVNEKVFFLLCVCFE